MAGAVASTRSRTKRAQAARSRAMRCSSGVGSWGRCSSGIADSPENSNMSNACDRRTCASGASQPSARNPRTYAGRQAASSPTSSLAGRSPIWTSPSSS